MKINLIMENEDGLKCILEDVREYFNKMILYTKKNNPRYPHLVSAREAAFKLNRVIDELKREEVPNWYRLYEGLCGSYIKQREDLRAVRTENQELRRECKEWKQRFLNASERLKEFSDVSTT